MAPDGAAGAIPHASALLITADGGGSNGVAVRLWKMRLQKLADETGLDHQRLPLPAGHQQMEQDRASAVLAIISQNWRGKPLVSHEVIVNLIAATKTRKGLAINAAVDTNEYVKGSKVPDTEMEALAIRKNAFHGEWNYALLPRKNDQVIL